jgi:iron only hydrogenase large subunit-like protein
VNGEVVFRFCAVYGFRHVHHVTRALKQGSSEYDFVEIMACPGGCVNGGGQIKLEQSLQKDGEHVTSHEFLKQVRIALIPFNLLICC